MYATFENLLQQVMSHFLDFDVTEQDKLRGIDNYKLWAAMVKSRLLDLDCHLDLYLSNVDIPGVSEFTDTERNVIRLKFDLILDKLLKKCITSAVYATYCTKRGLRGLNLWHALFRDFGTISVKQHLELHSTLTRQLFDSTVSLAAKIQLLEDADLDLLPLDEGQRILFFHSCVNNSTVKNVIIRLDEYVPSRLNWLALKDGISEILHETSSPVSDESSMALVVLQRNPRRIMIKSKLTCFKCGGIGHKLNVCPSRSDDEYWNLQPPKPTNKPNYFVTYTEEKPSVSPTNAVCGLSYLVPKPSQHTAAYADTGHQTSSASVSHGCAAATDSHSDVFLLDTGASVHITHQKDLLHDFNPDNSGTIAGLDPATTFKILGTGTLKFTLPDGSILPVEDVQYVPSCGRNLISVSRASKGGSTFHLLPDGIVDLRLGLQVAALTKDDLYQFSLPCLPAHNVSAGTAFTATMDAHSRLGHPSRKVAQRIGTLCPSYAAALKSESKDSLCESCIRAKATHALPKTSTTSGRTVKTPLELVHSDVCGPFSQPSLTQDLYYVVFVDDYTHYMAVYPVKQKSDVYECARSYFLQSERFFHNRGGYKPVTFRTDNGGEYMSSQLQQFLKAQGITHQTTVAYNSHQNGVSERAIRTINEKCRAMMFHASTPLCFWAEAVACATYLLNRLPSTAIDKQYPYQRWYKSHAQWDHLRPFGCMAYALIPQQLRSSKLSPRSIRGVMLGYAQTQHAYRIFDLDSGKVAVSNNVKFDEFVFPFQTMTNIPRDIASIGSLSSSLSSFSSIPGIRATAELPGTLMSPPVLDVDMSDIESDFSSHDSMVPQDLASPVDGPSMDIVGPPSRGSLSSSPGITTTPRVVEPLSPLVTQEVSRPRIEYISDSEASVPGEDYATSFYERHHDNFDKSDDEDYVDEPVRRRRAITMPDRLRRRSEVSSDGETEPSKKLKYETLHTESDSSLVVRGSGYFMSHAYVVSTKKDGVPVTYKQAMLSDEAEKWKIAMDSEMSAHYSNNTWDLVLLPKDRKAIGNRWVFTKKDDGRYKARLVAQGFSQVPGEDYLDTFSPVIRYESVKLLLAFSAVDNRVVHQMDVDTAFLNGTVEETLYMKQPVGFINENEPEKVCKLNKSLYGLKQAPICWNTTISDFLAEHRFNRIDTELGIYVRGNIIIGLYVDDILISGKDMKEIEDVKKMLALKFKMKDLGVAKKFLGINIAQDTNGIKICLYDYIGKVLQDFEMTDANTVATPTLAGEDLHKDNTEECDATRYRSLVGKLLFASTTVRTDIAYAVGILSRHLAKPSEMHMKCAKHVLRYLKGTQDIGHHYTGDSSLDIYCDSDWASDKSDRKSITGYIVRYGGAPISWKSKKQTTVAMSTTEAEYLALGEATKEALWIIMLFDEMRVPLQLPISIHEDNNSCILLAEHPVFHLRTKHIDIRHHFIREHIIKKQIKLCQISTHTQIADMLTKGLNKIKFQDLRSLAGMTRIRIKGKC